MDCDIAVEEEEDGHCHVTSLEAQKGFVPGMVNILLSRVSNGLTDYRCGKGFLGPGPI